MHYTLQAQYMYNAFFTYGRTHLIDKITKEESALHNTVHKYNATTDFFIIKKLSWLYDESV